MNQNLLNELIYEMEHNSECSEEEYYGRVISVYNDIDKYLSKIPDIYDKIVFAQYANNYKKVDELISLLQLDNETQEKYNSLLQNNGSLNETIDIRVLSHKYDFLTDMLDMFTANMEIQERVLSLSDDKLELFKLMYRRIGENTDYKVPCVTGLLNRLGTVIPDSWKNRYYKYEQLEKSIFDSIKSGEELSTEEIDNLLYLYSTNIIWDVNSREELHDFARNNGVFQTTLDNIIQNEQGKEVKDVDKIKSALLLKAYGVDLKGAEALCKRYNIKGIPITQENADIFEMYRVILEIIGENNPNILMETYKQFSENKEVVPNFMRIVTFENAMRKEFAKSLNASVFNCTGECTHEDGVKVFDAGTDFKMIVTAIGAYKGDFGTQNNYKDYWNAPRIRSHGNCCSLIGNNNLSMIDPPNVIFGFSSIDDNMLLLSSNRDINSTPDSREFNIAAEEGLGDNYSLDGKRYISIKRVGVRIEFTNPDRLLDITRGDYNELVYERRDLSSNPPFYKKNPDYIVHFEEYEKFDDYIKKAKDNPEVLEYLNAQKQQQEFRKEQSFKAAKDFGIPVVIINREKCAKQEIEKIEQTLSDFENSLNPELLKKVICQFENNRVGNHDYHAIIREKYFSTSAMDGYLSRIEQAISIIKDKSMRTQLINEYYNSILEEQKKVKLCDSLRNHGQTSGIDFKKTIDRINNMRDIEPELTL